MTLGDRSNQGLLDAGRTSRRTGTHVDGWMFNSDTTCIGSISDGIQNFQYAVVRGDTSRRYAKVLVLVKIYSFEECGLQILSDIGGAP
jgi:membrane-bound lytic murein transglycosylase MltF